MSKMSFMARQRLKAAVRRVFRNPATSKAAKVRAGKGLTQRKSAKPGKPRSGNRA